MKIAYYSNYVGKEFAKRYCNGVKYAISGPLKTQGIARALLSAGHKVVIFSPGITNCNCKIEAFTETEEYPEGDLVIHYCDILSFRRRGPINDYRIHRMIAKADRIEHFDAYLYYNPYLGAVMNLSLFRNRLTILEYEDNVYNKYVVGAQNPFEGIRAAIYKYVVKRTDAAFIVCKGMFAKGEVKDCILTPGVINDDVTEAISFDGHQLAEGHKTKIILTGGTGYDKGSDVIIEALQYVQSPCSLDFYTNGTFFDQAKALIAAVPDRHEINIKGYLPHKDLMKVLVKDGDVFLSTTRSMGVAAQSAGFPFKIMEYAALGRPIISSELAKLDEEFNSRVNYYEGDNPKALASIIDEVIKHYDDKSRKAIELQKLVLDRYTIKGLGSQLKYFLDSLSVRKTNKR